MDQEQRNRAVFRTFVEDGINRRNLDILDDLMTPTIVDHDLPPGTPPGPAGVKEKLSAFLAAFPDLKATFETEVYQGDKLAGRGHLTGTHRGPFMGIAATGKTMKMPFMDLWRFENGKVAEYWVQADRLCLLQQIGAIAGPPL